MNVLKYTILFAGFDGTIKQCRFFGCFIVCSLQVCLLGCLNGKMEQEVDVLPANISEIMNVDYARDLIGNVSDREMMEFNYVDDRNRKDILPFIGLADAFAEDIISDLNTQETATGKSLRLRDFECTVYERSAEPSLRITYHLDKSDSSYHLLMFALIVDRNAKSIRKQGSIQMVKDE